MRRAPVVVLIVAVVAAVAVVGASAAAVDGSQPAASAALDGEYTTDGAYPNDGSYPADGGYPAGGGLQDGEDAEQSDAPNRTEQRAAVASGERLVEPCAAASPSDHEPPADDAIGWEAGYWYDEPVGVDDPESLTESELEAVVARTAARVEALRCLEFESVPQVEVVNRSEMADRQTRAVRNRSQAAEQFDDARLEAALLVGTDADPSEARISTRAAAVQASYDPATGRVALLAPEDSASQADGQSESADANQSSDSSENDDTGQAGSASQTDATVRIDEATLAHELVHALQDQAFDLSRFDAQRTDVALAESGLIEGGAVLVERRYEQRCDDDGWNQACLTATAPEADGDSNLPLNLLLYQPYNDGPRFVERAYDDGGWAAVDERYEEPPRSTREVLYPDAYDGTMELNLTTDATSTRQWRRVRPPDSPNDDVVGPGAIAAALLAPTFEGVRDPIYDPEAIHRDSRQPATQDDRRFDYRLDAVDGWQADRLVAYEDQAGRTGAIWRSRWETSDDAETFRSRYTELLEIRGADPAYGYQGTYRFAGASDFDGVVYVQRQENEVVIVHGPDVSALRAMYDGAAPQFEGGFFSDVRPGPGDVSFDELSAPTALSALVAVLLAAVAVRRWGRRRERRKRQRE